MHPKTPKIGYHWTDELDNKLRENIHLTWSELGDLFPNRTHQALRTRCNKLKLNHLSDCQILRARLEAKGKRKCTICGHPKLIERFYKNNYQCKECMKEYRQRPEVKKAKRKRQLNGCAYKRAYTYIKRGQGNGRKPLSKGTTLKYVLKLAKQQDHKSAISGKSLNKTWTPNDDANNPSIDRIDNNKGYEQGNIHWVTTQENKMRRDYPLTEFYEICKQITEHQTKL